MIATDQKPTNEPLTPTVEKVDYYRILGIKRNANLEEIKEAFREQAKIHHPDTKRITNDQDITVFKLINEAYTILSNPITRKEYDNERFGRAVSLRSRNEGTTGYEFDRPTSIYTAGPHWQSLKGTPAAGGPTPTTSSSTDNITGSTTTTASLDMNDPNLPANVPPPALPPVMFTPEDSQEAFRLTMNELVKN